ncbi:MAG: hypothetical protein AAF750_07995 [Planctomycetota bacterium]
MTYEGFSLQGEKLLRDADAGWVGRLAVGAGLIVVSVVLGVAAGLALVVGEVMERGGGWEHAFGVVEVVLALVYVVGVWWLTEREPGVGVGMGTRRDPKSRRVARVMAVTAFGSGVLAEMGTGLGRQYVWLTTVGEIVDGLTGLIGYVALFVYLQGLAWRLPDEPLADSTRTVMWGVVLSSGVVFLLGLLGVRGGLAGLGMCAAAIALLVFALWTVYLLARYRVGLRAVADEVERRMS